MADGERDVDRVSVCEYQLRMTLELSQMADRKARFLMRIGLGLLAATLVGLWPSVDALRRSVEQGAVPTASFAVALLLYSVCVGCLLIAMMKVIHVVRPRIVEDPQARPCPFFFRSIAQMRLEEYKRRMADLREDDVVDHLQSMIYHNSVVTDRKFRKLDEAVPWLLNGGLVGFVFALAVIAGVRFIP